MTPWRPWWLSEEAASLELGPGGSLLVMESEAEGREGLAGAAGGGGPEPYLAGGVPAPPRQPLPPLSALTSAAPSPALQPQLADVVYAYCSVLRLYNGDVSADPGGAADLLLALSAVLAGAMGGSSGGGSSGAAAGTPPTPPPADLSLPGTLLDCIARGCQPPAGSPESRGFAVSVLQDVATLLRMGRPAVLVSLMHVSRLLEAGRAGAEAGGRGGQRLQEVRLAVRWETQPRGTGLFSPKWRLTWSWPYLPPRRWLGAGGAGAAAAGGGGRAQAPLLSVLGQ